MEEWHGRMSRLRALWNATLDPSHASECLARQSSAFRPVILALDAVLTSAQAEYDDLFGRIEALGQALLHRSQKSGIPVVQRFIPTRGSVAVGEVFGLAPLAQQLSSDLRWLERAEEEAKQHVHSLMDEIKDALSGESLEDLNFLSQEVPILLKMHHRLWISCAIGLTLMAGIGRRFRF